MNIEYIEKKDFTREQIEELFLSVNWLSGKYPERVVKALRDSSKVISAWDGERLIGLIRSFDDGEIVAFAHYLLVHPDYQGHGIAGSLLNILKEKYKDFLYFNIMPDEKQNIPFYKKFGFEVLEDGAAMQIKNSGL